MILLNHPNDDFAKSPAGLNKTKQWQKR